MSTDSGAIATIIATGPAPVTGGEKRRRMIIESEDGNVSVQVPYAPSSIDYTGRGRRWVEIDRPGRRPLLAPGVVPLSKHGFELFLGDKDPDVDVQTMINRLEELADSESRIRVTFSGSEGGLWRFTALSFSSMQRHHITQAITRAKASVEFTRVSDAAAAVGPVSGGNDDKGGGKKKDKGGRTYTVKEGDTLGRISQKFYDTPRRWRLIADANKIRNPKRTSKLKVGRKLRIPRRGGRDGEE